MKIALLGGMVNNMYLLTKALRRLNYNAFYIRDPLDTFMLHQPFWLDTYGQFSPSDIKKYSSFSQWKEFEEKIGWKKEPYLIDPLDITSIKPAPSPQINSQLTRYFFFRRYNRTLEWKKIQSTIKGFDLLISCGVHSILNARLSGKPYYIWSHGGDIRYLLGLEGETTGFLNKIYHYATINMLRDAFNSAEGILLNDPTSIYTDGTPSVTKTKQKLIHKNITSLPLPSFIPPPSSEKDSPLPSDKINILIPSRFDLKWKQQDIFLKGLAKSKNKNLYRVTILSWGKNANLIQKYIHNLGLGSVVKIVGQVFTKPMLLKFYKKHDIVVDQFGIGTFGSICMEALSVNVPVMIYIDEAAFKHSPEMIPPVLNARNVDDVTIQLNSIAEDKDKLVELRRNIKKWYIKNLGDIAFQKRFQNILGDKL